VVNKQKTNNKKQSKMKTKIMNLSEQGLQELAKKVGGKLWQKNGKTRIYVHGGDNYHYQGSWYYDIGSQGYWEACVYLTQGYNNKNRESYVNEHLASMDEEMNDALDAVNANYDEKAVELQKIIENSNAKPKFFDRELEAMLKLPPVAIQANPYYNPINTPIRNVATLTNTYLINFYHGAGKGYAYVVGKNLVGFTYNEDAEIENEPKDAEKYHVDFSTCQVCFRDNI
jgi:hypothetical protein